MPPPTSWPRLGDVVDEQPARIRTFLDADRLSISSTFFVVDGPSILP
jgi:hypothetical protein